MRPFLESVGLELLQRAALHRAEFFLAPRQVSLSLLLTQSSRSGILAGRGYPGGGGGAGEGHPGGGGYIDIVEKEELCPSSDGARTEDKTERASMPPAVDEVAPTLALTPLPASTHAPTPSPRLSFPDKLVQ